MRRKVRSLRRGRRRGRAGRLGSPRLPTAEALALLLDPSRVARRYLPAALQGYSGSFGFSPVALLSISSSAGYRVTQSELLPLSNLGSTISPSDSFPGLPGEPSGGSASPAPPPRSVPPKLLDLVIQPDGN